MGSEKERLLDRAQFYWEFGQPVPVDLGIEMMNAGLDVTALESKALDLGIAEDAEEE